MPTVTSLTRPTAVAVGALLWVPQSVTAQETPAVKESDSVLESDVYLTLKLSPKIAGDFATDDSQDTFSDANSEFETGLHFDTDVTSNLKFTSSAKAGWTTDLENDEDDSESSLKFDTALAYDFERGPWSLVTSYQLNLNYGSFLETRDRTDHTFGAKFKYDLPTPEVRIGDLQFSGASGVSRVESSDDTFDRWNLDTGFALKLGIASGLSLTSGVDYQYRFYDDDIPTARRNRHGIEFSAGIDASDWLKEKLPNTAKSVTSFGVKVTRSENQRSASSEFAIRPVIAFRFPLSD
ncbi:hypothetical protein [Pontixanthobacter sp.]|uniref:hypothetical protein n=1 Tax=Pontixanthobacter sp. TaxID=2792078 RepID=UPI003C7E952D